MTDIAAAIGLVQLAKLAAQHRPPAGDRRALRRGLRATCRSGRRSRRTAGRTCSTSTRSTSAARRDAIVADLARRRHRRRTSTTRSRSTASPTSWSAASTPTCRSPSGAAARTLALPMYPGLTDAEQDEVIDAVRARSRRRRELGRSEVAAGCRRPTGPRPATRRPSGRPRSGSARWVATTCGSCRARSGVRLAAVADPDRRRRSPRPRRHRRPGLRASRSR